MTLIEFCFVSFSERDLSCLRPWATWSSEQLLLWPNEQQLINLFKTWDVHTHIHSAYVEARGQQCNIFIYCSPSCLHFCSFTASPSHWLCSSAWLHWLARRSVISLPAAQPPLQNLENYSWLCTWVLGRWTQFFTLVQQVLNPRDWAPAPHYDHLGGYLYNLIVLFF